MNQSECHFPSLKSIAVGNDNMPVNPLRLRVKWFLMRKLSLSQFETFYKCYNSVRNVFNRLSGKSISAAKPVVTVNTGLFKPGDLVRVRTQEEVYATLDIHGKLKGCSVIYGMNPYYGTVQKVLKPVERFFDERDMQAKKCKGLVLLQGVICEGSPSLGQCDRSCYMFWREEWLEKID